MSESTSARMQIRSLLAAQQPSDLRLGRASSIFVVSIVEVTARLRVSGTVPTTWLRMTFQPEIG